MRGFKLNTAEFIARAAEVHGNFYDYGNVAYEKNNIPVTINCPIHGSFNQLPRTHLRGHGCAYCGRKRTQEGQQKENNSRKITEQQFFKRAHEIHGSAYDYSRSRYVNQKTKIEIVCPVHGSFFQTPLKHSVQGTGCPKCGHERGSGQLLGVYSNEYFENHPEKWNEPAVLYIASFSNEDEEFFKVGISIRLDQRFPSSLPYTVEIVETIETTLYDAFVREQTTLAAKTRYHPQHHFGGHTECFIDG